jgi:hypothetical protein
VQARNVIGDFPRIKEKETSCPSFDLLVEHFREVDILILSIIFDCYGLSAFNNPQIKNLTRIKIAVQWRTMLSA